MASEPPPAPSAEAAFSPGIDGAAAGASSSAVPSSIVMIGVPTSMVWPTSTRRSLTVPAHGMGSSTSDLAVSISRTMSLTLTVSPGLTRHSTISASTRPSPGSGSLNVRIAMCDSLFRSVRQSAVDAVEDAVEVGEDLLLHPARRVRDVRAADAHDRRLELVEALLGDLGGDLGRHAEERARLVDDDETPRLAHRRDDGVDGQRREGAQVDDLDARALGLGRGGRLEHRLDDGTVADERHVGALAQHVGLEESPRRRRRGRVVLGPVVVAPLRLEEDHRVVAGHGLLDHPVGVLGVAARDDAQARGVGEVGLGALGVVFRAADAAPERDADHHRDLDRAEGTGVHLGDLADDLVEGRIDEAVELDLADGAVAAQRHADRGADDAGLGERAVDDAVLAEVLLQALGDAEDATELADVLTDEHDLGVGLHGLAQAVGDALAERDLLELAGHQFASSKLAL